MGKEATPPGPSVAAGTGHQVRVAIPVTLLRGLIGQGLVCAADLQCLDTASRDRLRRLCLECCSLCPAGATATSPRRHGDPPPSRRQPRGHGGATDT